MKPIGYWMLLGAFLAFCGVMRGCQKTEAEQEAYRNGLQQCLEGERIVFKKSCDGDK